MAYVYVVEPLMVTTVPGTIRSREGCREVFSCTGIRRPMWRKVPAGELTGVSLQGLIVLASYCAAVFLEPDQFH